MPPSYNKLNLLNIIRRTQWQDTGTGRANPSSSCESGHSERNLLHNQMRHIHNVSILHMYSPTNTHMERKGREAREKRSNEIINKTGGSKSDNNTTPKWTPSSSSLSSSSKPPFACPATLQHRRVFFFWWFSLCQENGWELKWKLDARRKQKRQQRKKGKPPNQHPK